MTNGDAKVLQITVEVCRVDEHGVVSNWDDDSKLWLSFNEPDRTIGIAGNRAALTSLARHLLTLSQPEAQPGYNLYWEPESGWFETDEAGLHMGGDRDQVKALLRRVNDQVGALPRADPEW